MAQKYCPAVQAYKNSTFLASETARNIRILCEHEETKSRLEKNNITASVLIFGSARAKSSVNTIIIVVFVVVVVVVV